MNKYILPTFQNNIPNGKGWHYLTVKKLSALLRGVTSKHDGGFYCLNCFYSFRTKSKLQSYKKVCENNDFCGFAMSSWDITILKFSQSWKSVKTSSNTVFMEVSSLWLKSRWM